MLGLKTCDTTLGSVSFLKPPRKGGQSWGSHSGLASSQPLPSIPLVHTASSLSHFTLQAPPDLPPVTLEMGRNTVLLSNLEPAWGGSHMGLTPQMQGADPQNARFLIE